MEWSGAGGKVEENCHSKVVFATPSHDALDQAGGVCPALRRVPIKPMGKFLGEPRMRFSQSQRNDARRSLRLRGEVSYIQCVCV